MTKTAKLILKKAELFEKLALSGNRRDFLKALSQVQNPADFKEKYTELLQYANNAIRQIPANLRSTDDAKAAIIAIQNAQTIDDIGKAIPYMKKVVPWMRGPNDFETAYAKVRNDWQLPTVNQPAASTTKTNTVTTRTRGESIRQTLDALKNATENNNLQQMRIYIPKVEALLQRMTNAAASSPGNQAVRQLIQEGRTILLSARSKMGIGESDYIPPEEMPNTNVSELGDWGEA